MSKGGRGIGTWLRGGNIWRRGRGRARGREEGGRGKGGTTRGRGEGGRDEGGEGEGE